MQRIRVNESIDTFSRKPIVNTIEIDSFLERKHEMTSYNLRKPKIVNGLITVHYGGLDRLVVPPSLIQHVQHEMHDISSHPTVKKTS